MLPRWIRFSSLTVCLTCLFIVIGGTAQAGLFDKLKPGKRPHEKIEGTFIDTVEPGPWTPPNMMARSDKSEDKKASAVQSGMAIVRSATAGPATAPGFQRYLQKIADRLASHSPVTGAPIRIIVVGDRQFGTALATPDGIIAVPLGMLRDLENEDELAFWLAHEVAHVQLRHHGSDWLGDFQNRSLAMGEMTLGYVNAFESNAAQYTGRTEKTKLSSSLEDGLAYGHAAYSVTSKALAPNWNRDQEDEADLLALDLIIRAGYSGEAAFSAMEKMQVWATSNDDTDQLEAHQKKIENSLSNSGSNPDFMTALNSARAAAGSVWKKLEGKLTRKHRSPEERLNALFDYYEREYEDRPVPDLRIAPFEQAKKMPQNATVMRHYISGWNAWDAWHNGDETKAVKLARAAISAPTQSDPELRFIFYTIRNGQQQQKNAVLNLEYATRGDNATLKIYQQLIFAHVGKDRIDDAIKIANQAWSELDRPPALYPILIDLHVQNSDMKEAKRLANECKLNHRDELGKTCERTVEQAREQRRSALAPSQSTDSKNPFSKLASPFRSN